MLATGTFEAAALYLEPLRKCFVRRPTTAEAASKTAAGIQPFRCEVDPVAGTLEMRGRSVISARYERHADQLVLRGTTDSVPFEVELTAIGP